MNRTIVVLRLELLRNPQYLTKAYESNHRGIETLLRKKFQQLLHNQYESNHRGIETRH